MQNAIIINKDGYKIEYVQAEHITNENGENTDNILSYTLKDGEKVIYDTQKAQSMYRAKWTGTEWIETGSAPEPDVEALRSAAIAQTKTWVDRTLAENPLEYGGKLYSVTDEKQAWLSRTIQLGDIMKSKGIPENEIELPWNESGEAHIPWKLSDLKDLALAIGNHVTPFIEQQQSAEKAINEAVTVDEINAVVRGLADGEAT